MNFKNAFCAYEIFSNKDKIKQEKCQLICKDVTVSLQCLEGREENVLVKSDAKLEPVSKLKPDFVPDSLTSMTTNVIESFDMSVESGELVFIVGPVGSGKSTLLLTLLSEIRLSSGQIIAIKSTQKKVNAVILDCDQNPRLYLVRLNH